MPTIETVPLDLTLPTDTLGFVLMHPFPRISKSEPYKWLDQEKALQIIRIERCLEIASHAADSSERTHFTVFPEYAIPGLEGVAKIQEYVGNNNWRPGTVVIGGVNGLTKQEYSDLCQTPQTFVSELNRPETVNEGEWVNCMVTWLVTEGERGSRITKRWVQPKLCPSWEEECSPAQHMFRGKSVNIYESRLADSRTFRFFCLLCYDWVAPLNSGIVNILSQLNESWRGSADPKFIHLVFILQCNSKPNHASVLNTAVTYFNEQANPFVSRGESILAFVNAAGKPSPGCVDSYGFSSLIYSPNVNSSVKACPPSYAIHTRRLRQSDGLQTCRDTLFRENGACIHAFKASQPRFMIPTPAQTNRLQLDLVSVHGIDVDGQDPRTPGGPVAAIVKWVNDRLDLAQCLHSPSGPIQHLLRQKQEAVIQELRLCDHECLSEVMTYANNYERDLGAEDDKAWIQAIDQWALNEEKSLLTLLDALSLVTCRSDVKMDGVAQAYTLKDNEIIDIMVISGPTHRLNLERVDKLYPGYQGRRPLIISRDHNDGPLTDLDKSILDVSDTIRCGFHDLKDCLGASDIQDFMRKLQETIGM